MFGLRVGDDTPFHAVTHTEEGESNQRKVKGFIQRGFPGVQRERMGGFKRGPEMKTLRSHENASYDVWRAEVREVGVRGLTDADCKKEGVTGFRTSVDGQA